MEIPESELDYNCPCGAEMGRSQCVSCYPFQGYAVEVLYCVECQMYRLTDIRELARQEGN